MAERTTRFGGKHTPKGMLEMPFPVRPGVLALLLIPEDLTTEEAQRISRFVAALGAAGVGEQQGGQT